MDAIDDDASKVSQSTNFKELEEDNALPQPLDDVFFDDAVSDRRQDNSGDFLPAWAILKLARHSSSFIPNVLQITPLDEVLSNSFSLLWRL